MPVIITTFMFLIMTLLTSFHATANTNITDNTVIQTKVIGYLPTYNGLMEHINKTQLQELTHLNIAFLNPDKTGKFVDDEQFTCTNTKHQQRLSKQEFSQAVAVAKRAGALVSFSLGGALMPECAGDWRELLSVEHRAKLVSELINLVDEFNLDGLDMDIEGQLLTSTIYDKNFLPFIKLLSEELKSRNKILSGATGSYQGGMISKESLPYFDYISLMSYDAIGPTWGSLGDEHSPFEQAQRDVALWQERGLTPAQLVLGLPFYGYGFGHYQASYSFRQLFSEFGQNSVQQDLIGKACADCNYITFNGYQMIKKKTAFALQHGSGVMIWEISHDLLNENSLLNVIKDAVDIHEAQIETENESQIKTKTKSQ